MAEQTLAVRCPNCGVKVMCRLVGLKAETGMPNPPKEPRFGPIQRRVLEATGRFVAQHTCIPPLQGGSSANFMTPEEAKHFLDDEGPLTQSGSKNKGDTE